MESNSQISKEFFINEILSLIPEGEQEQVQQKLYKSFANYSISVTEDTKNKLEFNQKVLESFLTAKKVEGRSKNTIKLYNLYIKDFLDKVQKPVDEITSFDIRNCLMQTQEERKLSNRTLNSRRSCINSFLGWCAGERIIINNPILNIKPVRYEKIQKKPLTDRELLLIRSSCGNVRDRALIEFLYSTGVRVTELIELKISDVDLDKNEAIVLGKGNKHRKVYLNDASNYFLKQYLDSRVDKSEELFVSLRAPYHKLTKSGIEKTITSIKNKAGIERQITPHLFRHTCATNLLQRGMDITEIQKILGHENIATTMIYSKNLDEDIKNHHKKLIM